jgi:hypothetical protein
LRKALQLAPDYVDDNVQLGCAAATKERMRRGGRLLAPLSHYRWPIGMGYPRTPITEILLDAAASDFMTAAFTGHGLLV